MLVNIIFQKAVKLIQNQIEGFCGAYLAGSRSSQSWISELADVDIHIVVDKDKLTSNYYISSNRYGDMIHVDGIKRTIVINVGTQKFLIDYFLLPKELFIKSDSILKSHRLFAASSNLFHTNLVVDPYGIIKKQYLYIQKNFLNSQFILDRINFVVELQRQKLKEFQEDIKDVDIISPKILWDGPIWSLLCATIIPLTRFGQTPTYIRSLFETKVLLLKFGFHSAFEDFMELSGYRRLKNDFIIDAAKVLIDTGNIFEKISPENDYIVNNLRYKYWQDVLNKFVISGEMDALRSAICYVSSQIACSLDRNNHKNDFVFDNFWATYKKIIENLQFNNTLSLNNNCNLITIASDKLRESMISNL